MTTKGVEGTGNFGKFANFLFSTAKVIALRCAAVGSAVTFKQRQGKHVSTGLQITPANRWAGMQHRTALPFLLWCLSSSTLHHTGWADCVVLQCAPVHRVACPVRYWWGGLYWQFFDSGRFPMSPMKILVPDWSVPHFWSCSTLHK